MHYQAQAFREDGNSQIILTELTAAGSETFDFAPAVFVLFCPVVLRKFPEIKVEITNFS